MHARIAICLFLILPAVVRAEPIDQEAIKYIQGLQLPDGGFTAAAPDPKGSDKPVASQTRTIGFDRKKRQHCGLTTSPRLWKPGSGVGAGTSLDGDDAIVEISPIFEVQLRA